MSALPSALTAEFEGLTRSIVELAGRAMASGGTEEIAGADLEQAMTAMVKLYAAKAEREGHPPMPLRAGEVTPTEVVLIVSEMLRAANISLFDLAMWYRRGQTQ